MKKLKIFLLLSIILCFGFALSSEVHAQGDGPKLFEVGEVLPATKQLNITSVINQWSPTTTTISTTDSYLVMTGYCFDEYDTTINIYIYPDIVYNYDYSDYYSNIDIIIDTSSWTIEQRTVTQVSGSSPVYWEDLNAGPKPFEVGDELPAGYIKISWDFTGIPFGDNDDFWIYSSGDFFIHIWKIDRLTIDIMHEEFFANTPGEIVMTLSSPCTITSFDGDSNYYEYIDEALSWEVVDYADGYADGYATARRHYGWVDDNGHWYTADEWGIMSYEHAREEFGYYDPITDRWLSVNEYLDLYTGQDGFYNNFDKYFIPAMIIVFGGAIVLTILKVFKGRE